MEQWMAGRTVDKQASWMVGDKPSDVTAGRNLGIHSAAVGPEGLCPEAEHHVSGLDVLLRTVVGEI